MQFPSKSQRHSSQGLKNLPKVHLEAQKTMNSQGNTEQKQQCCRYHKTQYQSILQSYSNENSMVLAQEQT
jgi:hypothetical protein